MNFILFIFPILLLTSMTETANILAILPYSMYSHYASFMSILKELAQRGHNVTVFSQFPQKTSIPNLTDILIPNIMIELRENYLTKRSPKDMDTLWFHMFEILEIGFLMSSVTLNTEPMKKLISDENSKYDLIITETGLFHEPFVTFGHKFNASVINLLSLFFPPRNAYISGNSMPTSYVPVNIYFSFNDHMTFIERVQNLFFYYWDILYVNLYYYKKQNKLIKEHFKYPGSETIPSLEDMLRNTALTFMEHDFTVGYPAPLHKNVVLFTGVDIEQPEPLPQDLQQYMDESKSGVIYFSLGSLYSLKYLKPQMKEAIILTFNKLNHRIMMKVDDDSIAHELNKQNMMIKSWFPQRAILAHPNCKLFITHSGIHGTMEGFYHGVPMVAIPLVSDQKYNAKIIESQGLGISLDVNTITEEKLTTAIKEVFNNPQYKETAKKKSAIFKDKPMNTMDNAIYWIEYVIKYKGAPHLRPAVLDLYWFQRFMLDVIAFYLLLFIVISFILYVIVKLSCRFLFFKVSNLLLSDSIKSKKN